MENIKDIKDMTEFEKYQLSMAIKSRKQQIVRAALNRAKEADIPESEMRITEDEFRNLLDVPYFSTRNIDGKGVNDLCHEMFTVPDKLLNTPFILIDGGNMYSRRKAGFALLFRMITWDKTGKQYSCGKIVHQLQTWDAFQGLSRNDFATDLKTYDVLFINECSMGLFKPFLEAGSFMDEILEVREAEKKPTIFSFQQLIPAKGIESEMRASNSAVGQYMAMFSESDDSAKNCQNMLRIRIKG